MTIVTLGIDLGKTVCSLTGLDGSGRVVLRRRMRRDRIAGFTASLPGCTVGLEACCGAHHLGRQLARQGHRVRLMPPAYVRPYVKSHKNDDRDSEAVAEAATRPTMRTVALKTQAQLDLQTLHRVRERLVSQRTGVINQMRAILLERGVTAPRGPAKLARRLVELSSEAPAALSPRIAALLEALRTEWRGLDERIAALDKEFLARAREQPATRRLMTVPGVGPLTATALVAALGDGTAMARGRDLSAWLGLVPRQHSTGGRTRLGRITKRGNVYLRKLLIHGARAALPHLARRDSGLGRWLRRLLQRVHRNLAVVALANKLARIAWAVLRRGVSYADRPARAA
jgi:transposase